MPIGTAVHARTLALAESLNYREWSGYYAVSAYETHHEHEYNAIRNAAALIDISPLFKYIVSGRGAAALVDRVITRDARKLAVGQVYYTPWCDERGKVIDDGTVTRIGEDAFRWTAADPSLRWLTQNAIGLDVVIEDVSERVAALALQGPTSGRLLDIRPAGMLALDIARVEAGLLLIDVDFHSSKKAQIESQTYTPFEMGLGRLVQFGKPSFVGRTPLADESRRGPRRQIVGLDISWPAVEQLYENVGLAPQIAATASRVAVPVYRGGRQVGRATTTTWSPVLKKLIALATVAAPHCGEGTLVEFEVTVEAVRHRVPAVVVRTPFFNPARKTASLNAQA